MGECTVLDTFKFKDGTTCTLLAFHKPGEGLVNGCEMLSHGQADKASMDEAAFQKFWKNCDDVPSKWWGKVFVFPETPDSRGDVRCASRYFGGWDRYRDRLVNFKCNPNILVSHVASLCCLLNCGI